MANEEDYFRKLDEEAKENMRAALAEADGVAQRAALRALHHHRCGKCGDPMKTRAYRGVEIEECGGCGSVLLDPGELQKLAGDEGGALSSFFSMFR